MGGGGMRGSGSVGDADGDLQAALRDSAAEAAHAPHAPALSPAGQQLQEQMIREMAAEQLTAACQTGDTALLGAAIEEARASGVASYVLQQAIAQLTILVSSTDRSSNVQSTASSNEQSAEARPLAVMGIPMGIPRSWSLTTGGDRRRRSFAVSVTSDVEADVVIHSDDGEGDGGDTNHGSGGDGGAGAGDWAEADGASFLAVPAVNIADRDVSPQEGWNRALVAAAAAPAGPAASPSGEDGSSAAAGVSSQHSSSPPPGDSLKAGPSSSPPPPWNHDPHDDAAPTKGYI